MIKTTIMQVLLARVVGRPTGMIVSFHSPLRIRMPTPPLSLWTPRVRPAASSHTTPKIHIKVG
ncbi:hypothetical protein C8Q74DRAFT_1233822 [Fomes fomentarius]|nr:hypothetical protein C8Q74DRAFT_1233822 [Fomes fomentarius]